MPDVTMGHTIVATNDAHLEHYQHLRVDRDHGFQDTCA